STIDDFVNATSRGLPCRREPVMVYFGNDKITIPFHLLCNNTTPIGTTHCQPKPTRLCCNLCNPANFEDLMAATILKPA
ncbi:hypothetical protein L208DRAFT_1289306, partial [Tricholoma matsutake]